MTIDYQRMQRSGPILKRALTVALKSGNYDRVIAACARAIREWDAIGAWPDNWSHWQRALDVAYGRARAAFVAGSGPRCLPITMDEVSSLIADGVL